MDRFPIAKLGLIPMPASAQDNSRREDLPSESASHPPCSAPANAVESLQPLLRQLVLAVSSYMTQSRLSFSVSFCTCYVLLWESNIYIETMPENSGGDLTLIIFEVLIYLISDTATEETFNFLNR